MRATPDLSSGPDTGARPYLARRANGVFIGMFASMRDAQVPIEAAAGKRLKWIDETRHGIEASRGVYP